MEERNITPEESLSIIQSMINNTREKYANNGFSFLLWGAIVIVGSLTTYFAITTQHFNIINPTWMALMVIGIITTIIIIARRDKKNRYRSHIDFAGQMLWLSFMISYFIVAFGIIKFQTDPTAIFCVLLGMATFVSGALMKFTPLYFGGIAFWIASMISPHLNTPNNTLLMAAAMLIGYIVPGILLRIKVKREKNV